MVFALIPVRHREKIIRAVIGVAMFDASAQRLCKRYRRIQVKAIDGRFASRAFFTAIHGAFTWERHTPLEATAVESYELENYFPRVTPDRTMLIAHSGTGGSIETVEALIAKLDELDRTDETRGGGARKK